MFDIGWGELVVIGIVALIAIGPKELPTVLRTLGQTMGKIRRMASEFQGQFQEAMREAELHDLKKQAEEMTSSVTDMSSFDPMADVKKQVESAFEEPAKSESTTTEASTPELAKPDETAPAATPLPEIDVPMPELPKPASEKDFAAVETPPAKQAGGGT